MILATNRIKVNHALKVQLPLSLHKQHIRLFVKRLGEKLSVDWRNLHKIEPLV